MEILNKGRDLELVNVTNIVLIPKTSHPTKMTNFRPISLYNVLYKVIAKVVANRFQHVLDACIDSAQSAFVLGRLITDNVLVACEIMHTLKNKRIGIKGQMALKLEISKTYDRVEWDFLKLMMERMGFVQSWVDFVMKCLISVFHSIILNGAKENVLN